MTNTAPTPTQNRLARATSPYLLQHASNPVDWYEWGPEAFERAKREDKPIFLSIGYSACHWCHVMEHESFESAEVAAVLNEHFVSIKVDREERPDVDELYMAYTQAATGRGGWPMSVWLLPDGTPFYAGTYFPRAQFERVLTQLAQVWRDDRQQITANLDDTRRFFALWASAGADSAGDIEAAAVDRAARALAEHFDATHGGIEAQGNKFPPSQAMELMLRVYRRTGEADLLKAVNVTLDHMARGGIYDHLGGGIYRYSTDPEWLVPHFEKMLYDQALVSAVYLDAYQVTGRAEYAEVARGIFDYVISDLQSPEGGFYSSRDADSEGLEGAYYIWTADEVRKVLEAGEAELFCAFYDVTPRGNWHEQLGHAPAGPKNILHIPTPLDQFAQARALPAATVERRLAAARAKLLAVRGQRPAPGLDDKVLTAWNGLMIASLAKGACVLGEPRYAESAERAAGFLLERMQRDGRLLRTYRAGAARLTGYLDDYAFTIEGLLNLYEATFDRRWIEAAAQLAATLDAHYLDPVQGGYFYTADDAEALIARSKSPQDGAIPSGNSVQASNLLRLHALTGQAAYRERATSIFRAFGAQAVQHVGGFERLLCAADLRHDEMREIALVGPRDGDELAAFARAVWRGYLPNKVVVQGAGPSGAADPASATAASGGASGSLPLPLLAQRPPVAGHATAYVCIAGTCRPPITSPAELAKLLHGRE